MNPPHPGLIVLVFYSPSDFDGVYELTDLYHEKWRHLFLTDVFSLLSSISSFSLTLVIEYSYSRSSAADPCSRFVVISRDGNKEGVKELFAPCHSFLSSPTIHAKNKKLWVRLLCANFTQCFGVVSCNALVWFHNECRVNGMMKRVFFFNKNQQWSPSEVHFLWSLTWMPCHSFCWWYNNNCFDFYLGFSW